MSITTIDYTQINGAETGVQVLADIKAQMQNAETDMALRTTYSEDTSVTGAWDFDKRLTVESLEFLRGIHSVVAGGNTLENEIRVVASSDGLRSMLKPYTDGASMSNSEFYYHHADDKWVCEVELQTLGSLNVDGSIALSSTAISGTANVSGIWNHSVEMNSDISGTAGKFYGMEAISATDGAGLAFHFRGNGDTFRLSPFNDVNVYNASWGNSRGLMWSFLTDEWSIGGSTLWHNGNLPIGGDMPTDGEILKYVSANSRYEPQPLSTTGIVDFKMVDGNGTTLTMGDNNYFRFLAGANSGIEVEFTDTFPGSSADPYDLTVTILPSLITAKPAITSGVLGTDELLLSDSGVLKRMDLDVLKTWIGAPDNALEDSDFTSDGIMVRRASGVYASRTLIGGTNISITNGDGDNANPTISLSGNVNANQVDGKSISVRTQASYDGISPDANTLYFIVG